MTHLEALLALEQATVAAHYLSVTPHTDEAGYDCSYEYCTHPMCVLRKEAVRVIHFTITKTPKEAQ